MGSPLAPVLANFFMGHYEKLWLNNYTGPRVLYYRVLVEGFYTIYTDHFCKSLLYIHNG